MDGERSRSVLNVSGYTVAVEFSATARRLGIVSAVGVVVLGVSYAVTLAVVLFSLWSPQQPIGEVSTMETLLSTSVARARFSASLLTVFSFLALVMAAVGIYGVMSYSVLQRTHGIGVRMALGAQRYDVLKLMVKKGIVLGVAGVVVGLAASFALTRLIATLLFDVTTTDAATFAIVSAGLFLVTLIACYVPARRATKVDPLKALRYE